MRTVVDQGGGPCALELPGIDPVCLYGPVDGEGRFDEEANLYCAKVIDGHRRPADGVPAGLAQRRK